MWPENIIFFVRFSQSCVCEFAVYVDILYFIDIGNRYTAVVKREKILEVASCGWNFYSNRLTIHATKQTQMCERNGSNKFLS